MKGMPFDLQGNKGVLFEVVSSGTGTGRGRGEFCGAEKWKSRGGEPTSVLDTRRSPSPPTSASSTLSSSLGGSTDTGGVAAVSNNPPPSHNWPSTTTTTTTNQEGNTPTGGVRKDEWNGSGGGGASGSELQLQPIPSPLEGERCGMEDWESMLSDSGVVAAAAASPSQDQSLLRWIMGDVEDPSSGLKQLLQGGALGPHSSELLENSSNNAGFGLPDPSFGFEGATGVGTSSGFGFSGNGNGSGRGVGVSGSMQNHSSYNLSNKISPSFNSNPSNPNTIFSSPPNTLPLPMSLPPGVFYQQQQNHQFEQQHQVDQKPQLLINHPTQNQAFFVPLPYAQETQQHNSLVMPPQPKRHHSAMVDHPSYPGMNQQGFPQQLQLHPSHLQHRSMLNNNKQQKVMGTGEEAQQHQQQQQQALVDQLFKAAELVESGNLVHARGILARLNHQLSSPVGKPIIRASYYFKEALQMLLLNLTNNNLTSSPARRISTPLDVFFKIDTYKSFSEISPILQFVNFTCNQALLEALANNHCIHIIDFDIGFGGQWASFMQEIAMRVNGAPSLKITAIASPSSHDHPLELLLTQDNLAHFANDLRIPFTFELLSLDSFESLSIHESEAIAVNLPSASASSSYHPSSLPSLLRLVKQISPKIVVTIDRGCDRGDLPFAHHFLHAIQSYSVLFDSLDSVNTNSDIVNKIERFLLQPRIESAVLRRHHFLDKLPPWRTLFATAGFSPFTFSNFCETQAECLVKRLQVRGFHVEKRQASLVLYWQRRELVSASAWSC